MRPLVRRLRILHRVLSSSEPSGHAAVHSTNGLTQLTFRPRTPLIDETIQIIGHHLPAASPCTIKVSLQNDDENLHFTSLSYFTTSEEGSLNLAKDRSVGGSYEGVDPMGPFWSMKADPGSKNIGGRLLPVDVTKPLEFKVQAFLGHLHDGAKPGRLMAETTCCRAFMSEGVRRIPIREGRVRGTLFLPPGDGPHPLVITIYGGIHKGKLIEDKAAVFASRGFASLALAFFKIDDLPKGYDNVDIEYFEEAIDLMKERNDISEVGLWGISKGGDIALSIISFLHTKVKSAVILNCAPCSISGTTSYKGHVIKGLGFENMDMSKIKFLDDGSIDALGVMDKPTHYPETLIPFGSSPVELMWIAGDDDHNFESSDFAVFGQKLMIDNGKTNYEILRYPGLGHLVDLPFHPPSTTSLHPLAPKGTVLYMGGNDTVRHVKAQIDIHHKVIEFYKRTLVTN